MLTHALAPHMHLKLTLLGKLSLLTAEKLRHSLALMLLRLDSTSGAQLGFVILVEPQHHLLTSRLYMQTKVLLGHRLVVMITMEPRHTYLEMH